jgi:hypothetical protein
LLLSWVIKFGSAVWVLMLVLILSSLEMGLLSWEVGVLVTVVTVGRLFEIGGHLPDGRVRGFLGVLCGNVYVRVLPQILLIEFSNSLQGRRLSVQTVGLPVGGLLVRGRLGYLRIPRPDIGDMAHSLGRPSGKSACVIIRTLGYVTLVMMVVMMVTRARGEDIFYQFPSRALLVGHWLGQRGLEVRLTATDGRGRIEDLLLEIVGRAGCERILQVRLDGRRIALALRSGHKVGEILWWLLGRLEHGRRASAGTVQLLLGVVGRGRIVVVSRRQHRVPSSLLVLLLLLLLLLQVVLRRR